MKHLYKSILCAIALMFLSGCGKVDLYSNLQEKHANEIMSILQQHKIGSKKIPGTEGTWTIVVNDSTNFSRAVEILSAKGYPLDNFENLGQVFKKSGLVSSPLEEKARLMYALSGDIGETITKIPGVLSARVHVVLPENDPYSDNITPSSAAVLVTYRPESNLEEYVRDIKNIVTNSIESLDYDKVSVSIFPVTANDLANNGVELVNLLGVLVTIDSVDNFWSIFIVLLCLILGLAGSTVYFYLGVNKAKKGTVSAPRSVPLQSQSTIANSESKDPTESENPSTDQ